MSAALLLLLASPLLLPAEAPVAAAVVVMVTCALRLSACYGSKRWVGGRGMARVAAAAAAPPPQPLVLVPAILRIRSIRMRSRGLFRSLQASTPYLSRVWRMPSSRVPVGTERETEEGEGKGDRGRQREIEGDRGR